MKEIIVVMHLLVPEDARALDRTDELALSGHVTDAGAVVRAGVRAVYGLTADPAIHMAIDTDRTPTPQLWEPAELEG